MMMRLKWIMSWVGITLFTGNAFAQFKDSLAIKEKKMAVQFLPFQSGNLLFAAYQMEPADFIKRVDDFRARAHQEIKGEKDAQLRMLKMNDIDFYGRNLLFTYKRNYGIDSVKQKAYYAISQSEQNKEVPDTRKVDSAFKAIRVKTLSKENGSLLDSLVFKNWEITDSLLFVSSQSYRDVIGEKISWLISNVYRKEYTPGNRYNILLKIVREHIKDNYIKQHYQSAFTANVLRFPLDTAARETAYRDFLAAVTDTTYLRRVKEIYENYKAVRDMTEAPDFDYPDIDNKKVSLKSLRGKYVYIDFWATWCTPCKAEIPHLEKLQELYKDKNITFVSLSLDRLADKKKWELFVRQHQLGGIQLLAEKDFESDFAKKFNITSIPRFVLIDPQGKIVSANANRPSDARLKKELDTLLK